jgi:hypothetical protein
LPKICKWLNNCFLHIDWLIDWLIDDVMWFRKVIEMTDLLTIFSNFQVFVNWCVFWIWAKFWTCFGEYVHISIHLSTPLFLWAFPDLFRKCRH